MAKIIASEFQEQAAVIEWWRYACLRYGVPECSLLHVANEGTGSAARGRLQKRQGVRAGVSDLFLSVPRGGRGGLWIEMKRKGSRVRPEQREFLGHMQALGYDGAVCHGFDEARRKIVAYMHDAGVTMRTCLYCGEPLPAGCSPCRLFCCTLHRRQWQNERRRDERAEAREAREAGKSIADPWARCDLDDWTAEEIYGNALLDPLPVGAGDEAVAGPMSRRPKKRASWKDRWLSML